MDSKRVNKKGRINFTIWDEPHFLRIGFDLVRYLDPSRSQNNYEPSSHEGVIRLKRDWIDNKFDISEKKGVLIITYGFENWDKRRLDSNIPQMIKYVEKYNPAKLAIVAYNDITDHLQEYLHKLLIEHIDELDILDAYAIEQLMQAGKFSSSINLKTYEETWSGYRLDIQEIVSPIKTNPITTAGRNFYLLTGPTEYQDPLSKRTPERVWRREFNVDNTNIRVGDIVFERNKLSKKRSNLISIRAVGLVMEKWVDKPNLIIIWNSFSINTELYLGELYQQAFQKVENVHVDGILESAMAREFGFDFIVKKLDYRLVSQNIQKDNNFWWFYLDSILGEKNEDIAIPLPEKMSIKPLVGEQVILYHTDLGRISGVAKIDSDNSGNLNITITKSFRKEIHISMLKVQAKQLGVPVNQIPPPDVGVNQVIFLHPEMFVAIMILYEDRSSFDTNILQRPLFKNQLSKSGYSNDSIKSDKDLLNIENDVRAFALLLASKEVEPPLAIALFGKWGTGKSFFMKHLEKRIRELSIHQRFLVEGEMLKELDISPNVHSEDQFNRGIAHIRFNAWSYLDANLWAGLTHSLFEKLNEYITNTTKGEIERLKVQVRITKRLKLLHGDLYNFKRKRQNLESLKKELEGEKNRKISNYFSKVYETELVDFLSQNNIPESLTRKLTPSSLKQKIKQSTSLWIFLKHSSALLLLCLVLLIIFLVVGKEWLVTQIKNEPYLTILDSWIATISTVLLPTLMPIWDFIYKKRKSLKKISNHIEKLQEINTDNDEELKKLKQDLKELNPVILEVETRIKEEYSNKNDITQLAISDFIASKSNQKEYTDRLGIVSVIRKDFETLNDLFYGNDDNLSPLDSSQFDKQKKKLSSEEKLTQDRQFIFEQFEPGEKLERIILYIDDLDRCSNAKVLEVIQAVNLLMAFPLFNVVVGVDKKCVHNALNYQYLLRYDQFITDGEVKNRIDEVRPEDYMEKIFQIPFQLEEASDDTLKDYVHELVKDQITKDDNNNERQVLDIENEINQKLSIDSSDVVVDESEKHSSSLSDDQTPVELENITTIGELSEGKGDLNDQPYKVEVKELEVTPKDLKLTSIEFVLLKEITWLVGTSPRTIKRFINIYRIIRAHEQLAYYEEKKHDDFLAVMFLLALSIGDHQQVGQPILEILSTSESDKTLSILITELTQNDKNEEQNRKNVHIIRDKIEKNEKIEKLMKFTVGKFRDHLSFVKRFSFGKDRSDKTPEIVKGF